jgi:signal transduction histidine kinase
MKLAIGNTATAAMAWLVLLLLALAARIWKPPNYQDFLFGVVFGGMLAALIAGSFSFVIAKWILAPLAKLTARMRRLSVETLSDRLPVSNPYDELGQLASSFNDTLNQLEISFAQLDRLTADVSHELRTPLTAMRTVGEVALRESNPAILHDAVGSMLEEIRRMNQLIERLLLLTRPGGDEMPLKLEAGLVRPVLLEVSESLSLVAEEKKQALEVDCADHLLAVFDPALLRLALINLVQNAIRYSPPGKVIWIRASAPSDGIAVEVADQGPGIATEHQRRIFERFYRVDKARSRAEGGVGLGLAIVKWAVERMGGQVELESKVGVGSVFRIRLRRVTS